MPAMESSRTSSSEKEHGANLRDSSDDEHRKWVDGGVRLSDSNNDTNADRDVEKPPAQQQQQQQQQSQPQSEKDESAAGDRAFLVDWEENDPKNPRNWPGWYKTCLTFQLGMLALGGSLGSSIISPTEMVLAHKFHVGSEVTVLCVSLYVLGFAFGPSIWAPIAEAYGRRISILPAVFVLGIFSIGTAVSDSLAAVLVTRFFAGVFGSAPISNVSAALGDMYTPSKRGTPVSFYSVAVCGGPTLGPVMGSALTLKLGWRWTEYIQAIWVFFLFSCSLFLLPETFAPVLLSRKAKRLRKETGDERYHHPHEHEKITLKNVLTKHVSRPLRMLLTEPMVTCIAIYASFVYGIVYLLLEVFPIVYAEDRHWGTVVSTLPFLAVLVGVTSALAINISNQPRYIRAVEANNGNAVPEARLAPMFVGGVLMTIGLFWFGWTAAPDIPWPASVVAAGFIGAGFNVIFQQCINFLVDVYGQYAASAVSANTLLRSLVAAGLPLAAPPMFHNLGVGPACSLLGGITALALPVPFIFMRYGLKLRRMSKFAPVED